jgi:hypothetical protein
MVAASIKQRRTTVATTVKQLINHLQQIDDQDQTVFYQYMLASDTDYRPEEFEKIVGAVEESAADNIARYMLDELTDGERYLEEEEEE